MNEIERWKKLDERGLRSWHLLEMSAKYLGVEIDPTNPRESRLKVAMAYDEKDMILEGIEAMTGIPLDVQNQAQLGVLAMQRGSYKEPRDFYKGFEPVDKVE